MSISEDKFKQLVFKHLEKLDIWPYSQADKASFIDAGRRYKTPGLELKTVTQVQQAGWASAYSVLVSWVPIPTSLSEEGQVMLPVQWVLLQESGSELRELK